MRTLTIALIVALLLVSGVCDSTSKTTIKALNINNGYLVYETEKGNQWADLDEFAPDARKVIKDIKFPATLVLTRKSNTYVSVEVLQESK